MYVSLSLFGLLETTYGRLFGLVWSQLAPRLRVKQREAGNQNAIMPGGVDIDHGAL